MTLASSLLGVAGAQCPAEVARVLAAGGLRPAPKDGDPALLPLTAREVKRMPVDDAEVAVGYLDGDTLAELFRIDSRKTVRAAIGRHPDHLDSEAAVAVYRWLDCEGYSLDTAGEERLVSRMGRAELVELLNDASVRRRIGLGRGLAAYATDCATLDALLAEVSGGAARRWLLAAALSGQVDGVSAADAVALCGSDLDEALQCTPKVTTELVSVALGDQAVTESVAKRCHGYGTMLGDGVKELLLDELADGRRWVAALTLWRAMGGRLQEALDASDESCVAQIAPTDAANLWRNERELDERWTRVLCNRVLEGAQEHTWLVGTLAERCGDADVLARALEVLEGEAATSLAAKLCDRLHRCSTVELDRLREPLLRSDADVSLRARLLNRACDPEVVAVVVRELLDAFATSDSWDRRTVREQCERVLRHVPVPRELLAPLAAAAQDIGWLTSGNEANPADAELLAEVVRATEIPEQVVQQVDPARALGAFLERAMTSADTAYHLVRRARLDDSQLRALLEAHPESLSRSLLGGTEGNPLTHGTRAMVLEVGEWENVRLVESFAVLAPTEAERPMLTEAIAAESVGRPAARVALERIELRPDELRVALVQQPHELLAWVEGKHRTAYDRELFAQMLELLEHQSGEQLLALAGEIAALDGGTETLLSMREFLGALQGYTRYVRPVSHTAAVKVVWDAVHAELGDDTTAWAQITSELDRWPGTLRELLDVTKVVAGL